MAVVSTAAVLAAGCGGGGGGEEAAAPAPPATEGTTEEGAATPAPTPATGAVPWPAPANPLELTVEAGLDPERQESLIYHFHAHLDVFVNGEPVLVPAGIGINVDDPGVQQGEALGGPAYGGIELCDEPCISPLHTHDVSGVIHTESAFREINKLGQFFTEWGVHLDESCVGGYCEPDAAIAVYVDGEQFEGNPAEIDLTDRKEIAIVIGTPPTEIPSVYDPPEA
jgi:hypothetical protein